MIVPVYKKKGPTSREVLNDIKKVVKEKKVGHAGTLDPLAEGVLVVGIGRKSTKELHKKNLNEKEYIALIRLGESSTTDDAEGEKLKGRIRHNPAMEEIESVISSFCGIIKQIPPKFSAIKLEGREAYKWAREGESFDLKEREAEVKELEVMSYRYPLLKIRVITGRGAYVRSLARDIGKELGTEGYLLSLVRIRVGQYTLEDCKDITYFRGLK